MATLYGKLRFVATSNFQLSKPHSVKPPEPNFEFQISNFQFPASFHPDFAEREDFGLGGFGQDAQEFDRGTLCEGAG
jgi:hypothetical protein